MASINVSYSPYRNEFRSQKAAAKAEAVKSSAAVENPNEIMKIDISPAWLILSMFAMILLLAGLYLMNFNNSVTKGYQLKRLQVSQQELKEQADIQTLYLAKAKSMNNMMSTGLMDHMRKPNKVDYVAGTMDVIAKAN